MQVRLLGQSRAKKDSKWFWREEWERLTIGAHLTISEALESSMFIQSGKNNYEHLFICMYLIYHLELISPDNIPFYSFSCGERYHVENDIPVA